MRQRVAFLWMTLWIVSVLSVGCVSIQPRTFDQQLASSLTQVTSVRVIAADLVERGRMSAEDGTHILALTDNARMVIDQARAIQHTNEVDAVLRLKLARDILTQLEAYLLERQE